jgi:hypothetical protein
LARELWREQPEPFLEQQTSLARALDAEDALTSLGQDNGRPRASFGSSGGPQPGRNGEARMGLNRHRWQAREDHGPDRARELSTPHNIRHRSNLGLEPQREGIAKARAEGKYKGRAPTARAKTTEARALKAQGFGATQIAERLGIGRASVYRVLGEPQTVP